MKPQVTELLEQMRVQLVRESEAHGPDSTAGAQGDSGEAGELGAENEENAIDAFNLYFDDIVEDLLEEYELTEAEAEDFMFGVMRDMITAGTIPDMPEDEEDEAALAQWLGAVKSAGFEAQVLAVAEQSAVD